MWKDRALAAEAREAKLREALTAVMGEWREGYGLSCVDQVRAALAETEGGK